MSGRRCECGTVLSRFNKSELCAVCARKEALERLPVEEWPAPPEPTFQYEPGPAPVRKRRAPAPDALLCSGCWKGRHTRDPYGFATCRCQHAHCACGLRS